LKRKRSVAKSCYSSAARDGSL